MIRRFPQIGIILGLVLVALSAVWGFFPSLGAIPLPGLQHVATVRIALPLLLVLAISGPTVLIARYHRRENTLFVAGVLVGVGATLFIYIAMGLGALLVLVGGALYKQFREA